MAQTDPTFDPVDAINLLRSYTLHCRLVRANLGKVRRALEVRAEAHDNSKLSAEEFGGFSRINAAARLHPYGSPEYRAGLKAEAATVDRHYLGNSHHPEFYGTDKPLADHDVRRTADSGLPLAGNMGWLDLVEMVCDWHGAWQGYGSQETWAAGMQRQRKRYDGWFTPAQWWLIEQLALFLPE